MKIKQSMFAYKCAYNQETDYILFGQKTDSALWIFYGEVDVEFEEPAPIDVVAAQVEAIDSHIQALRAECHVEITRLEERKQSLLAIGHEKEI